MTGSSSDPLTRRLCGRETFYCQFAKNSELWSTTPKSSLTPTQTVDYLGMTLQSSPLRAFPTQARIQKVLSLVADFSSSREQPLSLWRSLLGVMSSMTALIPGARLRMRSLQLRLNVAGPKQAEHALISWDSSCHQDLRWWSDASHLIGGVSLDLPQPLLLLFTDASDSGWGASLGDDLLSGLWTPDISRFSINHCELLAILLAIRGFLHLLKGRSVSLFTDNTSALAYLRKEGGTRSATLNAVAQSILRLCEANGVLLLPQFVLGKLNVLADTLSQGSQVLGSEWTLCREVCRDLFRRWPVNIDFFATSMNHRLQAYFSPVMDPQAVAIDAMHQSWDGLPSVRLHSQCPRQGSTVSESGGNVGGSLLATEALVPGHLGASSRCAGSSANAQGPAPPASFPTLPSEPPHASHDWLSYCQRTACHLGFSSGVARQLTFCCRSSTHVKYQARRVTYQVWCRRQGHSISRPSILKIADFLLYLRRSLHLSYSSIVSCRSMLSAVFRFILPDVSSHPVLHDLLRSFRIERPLPSCRIPPWDLLRVLFLLRSPPFEPLSSCSLCDLTRKVLFLVSLATVRRVGELQAVSSSVFLSWG